MLRSFKLALLCILASFGSEALADDARMWQGVGRVNVGESGFCTGTLISPDLVLTAAHCFFDKASGLRKPDHTVEFLAGLSGGHVAAQRTARQVYLHPDYVYTGDGDMSNVHSDLAIIELREPMSVTPFPLTRQAGQGRDLHVVSYAKSHQNAPSLQKSCHVLAAQAGVEVTSCDVDFGSSGAPIFVLDGGRRKIASIVSAKGQWRDQKVAIATAVAQGMDRLMARVEGRDSLIQAAAVGATR